MQITNQTNQVYTPQFEALHVATCGKLNIYKVVDQADIGYLKTLPQKIDMKKLMPGLTKEEYERWHEMLEYAIDMMQSPGNTTYFETLNNKICGIITCFPDKTTVIDCICTWPIEFGKKVKFAGKSLFYKVFKDFDKNKGTRIKLDAITNGPYDTVTKYQELGLKPTSKVYNTKLEMEINKYKVKEILNVFERIINYKEVKPKYIDIKEIDIN
ncbi:hypothetical protein IJ541_04755 [bacterium]|nr:hypothetical protein [bacterium]